jgi:hypothetical protein
VLAGDVSSATSARLPRQFNYTAGADIGATRNLTFAFDLLGSRVFNGPRVSQTQYTDAKGNSVPTVTLSKSSFNLIDGSAGIKYSMVGTLQLTANLIFKLNDAGLRARVIPLIGLSYTF